MIIRYKDYRIKLNKYNFELQYHRHGMGAGIYVTDGIYKNMDDILMRIAHLQMLDYDGEEILLGQYMRQYHRCIEELKTEIKIPFNFGKDNNEH